MDSDPSSLTLGITFDSMTLRESVSNPYLDALVECYKDGNYSKLNESHANHTGSVGTENFDPPDDDCLDEDTSPNKSSITTQFLTKSSTYMHEQEPFDTYRCKVNQLCIDIGVGAASTIDPKAEITIWLQRFEFLRAAIHTTAANSLKSPYVLQERLRGIPLDDLFFEIPEQLSMSSAVSSPRSWLLFNEERFEYRNNCTFPWDGDYDAPPDLPLNKDATIVKECFDRIMQEADLTYMDDTYSRGLWIRRLARFARDGFRDCGEFERCDKFIQGWNNHIGDLSSIYVEPVYHALPEDGMHL
ncbi:hypothetical protein ACHAPG_005464 [Botrytis cinerea]